MSRTYRYTPVVKDNKRHSKKWARQQANRKIRRTDLDDVSCGCHYKKFYGQWDICDYKHRMTINDWLERWSLWYHHDGLYYIFGMSIKSNNWYGTTLQNAINKWRKSYYWK
jgi:hypothetical protein